MGGEENMLHKSRHMLIGTVLVLAAIKLSLLFLVGPGQQPDSVGYISFARIILSGNEWLHRLVEPQSLLPVTEFRIVGYPLIIAGAMKVAPENWATLMVIVQIAVSSVAYALLFRFGIKLGLRPVWTCIAVLAGGTSLALALDIQILSDSLNTSLILCVALVLITGIIECRPLGMVSTFCLGLIYLCAFLLREGNAILSVLFLLPLTARIIAAPAQSRLKSTIAAVLFFLPMMTGHQAYMQWNASRTGTAFVTTGNQTVYLQGLADAASKDPSIFDLENPVDRAARETFSDYSFSEVVGVLQKLNVEGFDGPTRASIISKRYFRAWRDHPVSMLRMVIGHIRAKQTMLALRPVGAFRESIFWVTLERPFPPLKNLWRTGISERRVDYLSLYIIEVIERAASIAITLGFLIFPPVWLLQQFQGRRDASDSGLAMTAGATWLLYIGYMLAHAMVHLETRYMAPVIPLLVVIGARGLCSLQIKRKSPTAQL